MMYIYSKKATTILLPFSGFLTIHSVKVYSDAHFIPPVIVFAFISRFFALLDLVFSRTPFHIYITYDLLTAM